MKLSKKLAILFVFLVLVSFIFAEELRPGGLWINDVEIPFVQPEPLESSFKLGVSAAAEITCESIKEEGNYHTIDNGDGTCTTIFQPDESHMEFTYIKQRKPNDNFGNGAILLKRGESYTITGTWPFKNMENFHDNKMTLIKFDVANLPDEVEIVSSKLILKATNYVVRETKHFDGHWHIKGTYTHAYVHLIDKTWSASTVTWNNFGANNIINWAEETDCEQNVGCRGTARQSIHDSLPLHTEVVRIPKSIDNQNPPHPDALPDKFEFNFNSQGIDTLNDIISNKKDYTFMIVPDSGGFPISVHYPGTPSTNSPDGYSNGEHFWIGSGTSEDRPKLEITYILQSDCEYEGLTYNALNKATYTSNSFIDRDSNGNTDDVCFGGLWKSADLSENFCAYSAKHDEISGNNWGCSAQDDATDCWFGADDQLVASDGGDNLFTSFGGNIGNKNLDYRMYATNLHYKDGQKSLYISRSWNDNEHEYAWFRIDDNRFPYKLTKNTKLEFDYDNAFGQEHNEIYYEYGFRVNGEDYPDWHSMGLGTSNSQGWTKYSRNIYNIIRNTCSCFNGDADKGTDENNNNNCCDDSGSIRPFGKNDKIELTRFNFFLDDNPDTKSNGLTAYNIDNFKISDERGCCGDDFDEFIIHLKDWKSDFTDCYAPNGDCGGTTQDNQGDQSCCGNENHCVAGGGCFAIADEYDLSEINSDLSSDTEMCVNYDTGKSAWVDRDVGDGNGVTGMYCENVFVDIDYEFGIPLGAPAKRWEKTGYKWIDSGVKCEQAQRWGNGLNYCDDTSKGLTSGSSGEGIDSNYCCGDDPNEYYVEFEGRTACCDTPDDAIDENGDCIVPDVFDGFNRLSLAVKNADISQCSSISDNVQIIKNTCYDIYASEHETPDACNDISDPNLRQICNNKVNLLTTGQSIECGNNNIDVGEDCESNSDCASTTGGACQGCACQEPICGDNIRQNNEDCDGSDSQQCSGICTNSCNCLEETVPDWIEFDSVIDLSICESARNIKPSLDPRIAVDSTGDLYLVNGDINLVKTNECIKYEIPGFGTNVIAVDGTTKYVAHDQREFIFKFDNFDNGYTDNLFQSMPSLSHRIIFLDGNFYILGKFEFSKYTDLGELIIDYNFFDLIDLAYNKRFVAIDKQGKLNAIIPDQAGSKRLGSYLFSSGDRLVINPSNEDIYVMEKAKNRISVFNKIGEQIGVIGHFNVPTDIAIFSDQSQNLLYVLDSLTKEIHKFQIKNSVGCISPYVFDSAENKCIIPVFCSAPYGDGCTLDYRNGDTSDETLNSWCTNGFTSNHKCISCNSGYFYDDLESKSCVGINDECEDFEDEDDCRDENACFWDGDFCRSRT